MVSREKVAFIYSFNIFLGVDYESEIDLPVAVGIGNLIFFQIYLISYRERQWGDPWGIEGFLGRGGGLERVIRRKKKSAKNSKNSAKSGKNRKFLFFD